MDREIARTGCFECGRPTYDPEKREGFWARGVYGGRLVLVCPSCQKRRPDWQDRLDRCPVCSSPRLVLTLGEIVCRACGAFSEPGA